MARSSCSTPQGKPSFALLQQRGRLTAPIDVKRAAVELPATFFAFDLLAFEDFDLRPLPLARRKELLRDALPALGPVRFLDHIEREGEAFLQQVTALGLEGIIAKKSDAPYRGGRSSQWLKIKAERTGDFVIVGFTEPKGSRSSLGALQLADFVDGALVYAGRVGTGFTESQLQRAAGAARPDRAAATRRASDRSCAPASRAAADRADPRHAHDDVGRADARVRGALSRVDAGWAAAPLRISSAAERQASARL